MQVMCVRSQFPSSTGKRKQELVLTLPQQHAADPRKGAVEAAAPDGNQGRCWDQRVRAESFVLLLFPALSEINSHMGLGMWFWAW